MSKYNKLAKLKGKIRECECSYLKLSAATGIPITTLSNRINGKSAFDVVQAAKICNELDIPLEQMHIFFL